MLVAVRCHACIMSGEVYKNVVITYDGIRTPSELSASDTIDCRDISLHPFTGEIHSTVDYNGIAVVGAHASSDIQLTISTLRDTVTHLAAITATGDDTDHSIITFYRLG